MVTAYPGVVAMVRAIRNAGLRTGLVTSKNKPGAERGLRLVGLDQDMELIIGADDVVNPKPHPEPIEEALRRLGQPAAEALYVGDSVHDMESGRAAGSQDCGGTLGTVRTRAPRTHSARPLVGAAGRFAPRAWNLPGVVVASRPRRRSNLGVDLNLQSAGHLGGHIVQRRPRCPGR
jgi:beta-phosphoglucomutase-like phosphatase (HAD superfamily)